MKKIKTQNSELRVANVSGPWAEASSAGTIKTGHKWTAAAVAELMVRNVQGFWFLFYGLGFRFRVSVGCTTAHTQF